MKIMINPNNLTVDDSFQIFHKVRAIIENDSGEFIISFEAGKCIFPGGKRENGETDLEAIQREIKEETGISISKDDFKELLTLETIYNNYYDYRTDLIKSRYTSTVYYYARTSEKINNKKTSLTNVEIEQNYKAFYVNKNKLIEMIMEDHSNATNGEKFDEENRIVTEYFFENKGYQM